jgi:lysophospholipase L1-like esterase
VKTSAEHAQPGVPPVTDSARTLLFKIAAICLVLALGTVSLEILLRVAVPPNKDFAIQIPHTRRFFHPAPGAMPGVEGISRYESNSRGLRGREFGPDDSEFRILAVGGSTTECLYLDQTEMWTHHLEQELGTTSDGRSVWVGNAGASGMTSRDHILHVKYLPKQYPRIDLITVLVGANDVTVALKQGNDFKPAPPLSDPQAEEEQIRRAFRVAPSTLNDPRTAFLLADDAAWYKTTAIWQVLKRARLATAGVLADESPLAQDSQGLAYVRWREHRRSTPTMLDTLPDLSAAIDEYQRNIHTIIDIAESQSIRIVFLTQPMLWKADITQAEEDLLWLGGQGDFQAEPNHAYYSARALAEAMARFNRALKQVCEARQVQCIDLAAEIEQTTENYFDDAHFTEAGSRKVGLFVARQLKSLPAFSGDG